MGMTALMTAFAQWGSNDPWKFGVFFLLALLSAFWKVSLPVFPGTVSVGSLFILFGFLEFSLLEILAIGCCSLVVQFLFDPRKDHNAMSLLFSISNLAIATTVGQYVFQATLGPARNVFWPLVAATAAFSLMNTFPAAAFSALSERRGVGEVWHECSFWTLPYYLLSAAIAAGMWALSAHFGWPFSLLILPPVYFIYREANRYLGGIRAHKAGTEEMALIHQHTLEALGLAIDARFRAADEELARKQVYALGIADEMGLKRDERDALRIATALHDIGTLAVPEAILSKPGRVTPEEFEKIKTHPVVGEAIVQRANFPFPVARIVRSHHERWNGQGYPDGLKGTEIPVGARILAAVDCMVALTTDRPYRKAVSFEYALAFLTSQSGEAFAPEVIRILLRRASDLERLAALRTGGTPAGDPAHDFVRTIIAARRESQETFELARELGASLSLGETLSTLSTRLDRMVPNDCLAVYLLHDGVLVPEHVTGAERSLFFSLEIPVGAGISGAVAETGKPLKNGDARQEFLSPANDSKVTQLRSALAVPLTNSKNEVVAVLTVYRRRPRAFTDDDTRILLGIRRQLGAAVENAMLYKRAEDSATTDHVTGLPNARSLFRHLENEMARCRRSGEPFTLALGDLDGFKDVNDRFGHIQGNNVLRAVGEVLQQNCREYDYVARMGGDEFVIVMPGLGPEAVGPRLRHIEAAVIEAASMTCPGCNVSLSVGEARYPDHGDNVESLLAVADQRMYDAKKRRKPQYQMRGYDFDHVASGMI